MNLSTYYGYTNCINYDKIQIVSDLHSRVNLATYYGYTNYINCDKIQIVFDQR